MTRSFIALLILVPTLADAAGWDCSQTSNKLRPPAQVVDDIVRSMSLPPAEAIELLKPYLKHERWQTRAAIYERIGALQVQLKDLDGAREMYAKGFDLEEAPTAIRENFRAALALTLSKQARDDDVIALFERSDRPPCPWAPASLPLAYAYAARGKPDKAEAIAVAEIAREPEPPESTDVWRNLHLQLACNRNDAPVCLQRWDELLRLPFRADSEIQLLTETLPKVRSWPGAAPVLAAAERDGLMKGGAIVVPEIKELVPLERIAPVYPRDALRAGVEGHVQLDVRIRADGTVQAARVHSAIPAGIFDKSALEAVKHWTFQPRLRDGVPVPATGTQTIDYRIERR